ncbi:hypothetical protein [Methylobacterium sp. GC_Met_2]|uniref:hypothetical protein n=1 Tax=Methylobacterium sp. GC_Met_2 TaxID=2937376 RepID=UPI00226B203C|nr:hypothetical protein [Methylobacterium sp. GC_Met_2]
MTIGFGSLPSFAGGDDQNPLSPALQQFLQQQQAQQIAQTQAPTAMSQDVPAATPPGFTGYQPQTPPTGAPTDVVRPGAAAAGTGLLSMMGPNSAEAATPQMSDREALIASAKRIGADPLDLATVMSYETGGTLSPSQAGGAGGRHVGLIQFGPNEQKTYGAHDGQSFQEQLPAVERYLMDRGFQPGMNRLDLYSTINAGRPGLYGASDAGNGGAPGNVADKVASMGPHEAKAAAFLGGSFTPQIPQAGQPQSLSPGIARPAGASMGSTAGTGAFGLGGIQAQGAPVPGQSSPTPDVASLSSQPLTATGTQDQQQSSPYGNIASALKAVAAGQQKQAQGSGGAMRAPEVGGRPISLQQARAMFNPGKFYGALRSAGVRSV